MKAVFAGSFAEVILFGAGALCAEAQAPSSTTAPLWDTYSDTWAATDALNRRLPLQSEIGPPRADRFVGVFYFLWLGAHVNGGPYDITKILARDSGAMQKKDSPLWGPLHAPHHWGESLFGYYLTDDAYVLRKHAQMLSDAGVDTLIFDVTNNFTYKQYYMALLRVFSEVRQNGGKTPQVLFLCPFGNPSKVVEELYRDLYQPGLYPELWFRWEGKPLILADPAMIREAAEKEQPKTPDQLAPGRTLGQSFTADGPFDAAGGSFPTWNTTDSAMTLTLYRGGPKGEKIASKRFDNVADNAWLILKLAPPQLAGAYYLEMSDPKGQVGWWSHAADTFPNGQAYRDGVSSAGDRMLRISLMNSPSARIREFFAFRKPQPDYFRGSTAPDMWSWLEVAPQRVFINSSGEKEQMSVGVAQNAVGGRLGSMSEPGALGRSFHAGAFDRKSDAVQYGYNFSEQWERALKEDPKFVFITGWNEWIAGRFDQFGGVKAPVMFVDEFDQEHSRDIEPMKGGHGDNYYYQMVSYIRRFKGIRKSLAASAPKTIRLDGGFEQWADVAPEFRDDIGDAARRNHPGYNNCARYVNQTGRNDFVALKVARDGEFVYFYARTKNPIPPSAEPHWMMLFIDSDCDHKTGWEGYDFVVNRTVKDAGASLLEEHNGAEGWRPKSEIKYRVRDNELMLAVRRSDLGFGDASKPLRFDFKWADNMQREGDVNEFTLNGDSAPNGRFNYHFEEK